MGKLGRMVVLAGAVEAARRYAKNNPEAVGKIADQAGRFVDQCTKGKYHSQIDGAVRKVQDATGRGSH
ncbi:MAG: antitoxin [Actinomycetota bacterium]|nr:antitoxin [Actinomycetota bacterium]